VWIINQFFRGASGSTNGSKSSPSFAPIKSFATLATFESALSVCLNLFFHLFDAFANIDEFRIINNYEIRTSISE
jgi:hypothetical protein